MLSAKGQNIWSVISWLLIAGEVKNKPLVSYIKYNWSCAIGNSRNKFHDFQLSLNAYLTVPAPYQFLLLNASQIELSLTPSLLICSTDSSMLFYIRAFTLYALILINIRTNQKCYVQFICWFGSYNNGNNSLLLQNANVECGQYRLYCFLNFS